MIEQASVLATAHYLSAIIGFAATAVAARLLSPSDFGTAAIAIALPTLVFTLADVKSTAITTRYVAMFHNSGENLRLAEICKLGFLVDTLIACAVVVVVYLISRGSNGYAVPHYIPDLSLIYALSYPFAALIGTSQAIVTGLKKFGTFAALQVADKSVSLILVCVVLLYWQPSASSFVFALALSQAAVGLMNFFVSNAVLVRDAPKWFAAPLAKLASLRQELASALGWNFVVVSCSGIVAQVPLLALGALSGPESAGFFRLALTITTVASYVEASFGRVAFTRLATDLRTTNSRELGRILKMWTVRGMGIATIQLVALLLLPFFVRSGFGAPYQPMVLGTSVLLLGNVVSGFLFWLNPFFYSSGRIDIWAKAQLVYSVCIISFGLYAGSAWGFTGMAIVVSGARISLTLVMAAVVMTLIRRGSSIQTNAASVAER